MEEIKNNESVENLPKLVKKNAIIVEEKKH